MVAKILVSLTRLGALDQVSARPNGIGRPPWEDRGVDDYLPTATGAGGGENSTEPIAEQTMSPLLIWAMRMVDDLSGDIIAAWAERQRLTEAARATTATPGRDGRAGGLPAVPGRQRDRAARDGCCPDPAPGPDGQARRHLIRGYEFKTATDEDGNHAPAGVEREVPWVAITPVVNAIRVLERMVPDGHLLFDHHAHDLQFARQGTGTLKKSGLRTRIEDFVNWANREAARHGLTGENIPDDPHGTIGPGRFRRSLAWHIAHRSNGLVALAIQYGHMRTALAYDWTTEGYGSRSRDGIHDLIDLETARATADTVMDLHESIEGGGGKQSPQAYVARSPWTSVLRLSSCCPSSAR